MNIRTFLAAAIAVVLITLMIGEFKKSSTSNMLVQESASTDTSVPSTEQWLSSHDLIKAQRLAKVTKPWSVEDAFPTPASLQTPEAQQAIAEYRASSSTFVHSHFVIPQSEPMPKLSDPPTEQERRAFHAFVQRRTQEELEKVHRTRLMTGSPRPLMYAQAQNVLETLHSKLGQHAYAEFTEWQRAMSIGAQLQNEFDDPHMMELVTGEMIRLKSEGWSNEDIAATIPELDPNLIDPNVRETALARLRTP